MNTATPSVSPTADPPSDRETAASLISVAEEIEQLEQEIAAIKAGGTPSSRQQITLPSGQVMTTGRSGGLSLAQAAEVRIFAHQLQRQRSPQAQLQQQGSSLLQQVEQLRPLLLLGCAVLAIFACWPLLQASYQNVSRPAVSRQPTAQAATVIQPTTTATPVLPDPTATISHLGLDAPDQLTIHAGAVDIRLPIQRVEDQRPAPLRILAPPAGVVMHYGSYPGEAGNLVLLGQWQGFGEQLGELQVNDRLVVTNRSGAGYVYRVVPCSPNGRLECIADPSDPALPLGVTASPTLTLVAHQPGGNNYIIQARFEQRQAGQQ